MTPHTLSHWIRCAATAACLFAAGTVPTAWAHTDEYLDTQQHPHGGQMRMAGAWHFELVVARDHKVAKEGPITVYVTDHADAPVSTTGATGSVTLLSGKEKSTLTLTPDGSNRLKGSGKYASTPDLKAVVSVTLAGKPAEQARFTPLVLPAKVPAAGKAPAAVEHKH